jgi:hypothetical protein
MCARCGEAAARYRCPGCEVVTCSLACTNEHKAALSCSGKRSTSATVVDSQRAVYQPVDAGAPHSPLADSARHSRAPTVQTLGAQTRSPVLEDAGVFGGQV